MPDQHGRVTGRDWLGLTGAISSIDAMRRGREYLGMQQAKEGRAATLFEQGQEDRAFDDSVKGFENEYIENLTANGLVDERGNPTDSWNSTMGKNLAESTRENTAIKKQGVEKELEAQGNNALASFTAQININSQLAGNAQSNKALTQAAFDKGRKDFENIKTTMTTASDFYRQGDTAKALKMAKETLDNSVMRRTGEIVDDKIYIIETVAGVKHRGPGFTYPEVEEFINNYTMEEHATGFAADAQVGREMALKPPTMMRTPDGKTVLVKQTGTSFGVDYFFFNPDGTVLENPPENLEQAYNKGWMKEEDVFKRERGIAEEERATMESAVDVALKEARTKKVQTETGQIGKAEPTKPEKPESAIDALTESEKLWRIIDDPKNKTVGGQINSGSLRNFNDLQRQRNLPLVSEQKSEEGEYNYVPDVSIYTNKGDKLEKVEAGKGVEYIKSLPVQTQELVMQAIAERQAGKASKLREKRKGKQKKANIQRETMKTRQEEEAAARERSAPYTQVGVTIPCF